MGQGEEGESRVSIMKAFVPAMITAAGAALIAAASWAAMSPGHAETASAPDAQVAVAVVVARATKACFTASIRVTGFLVARQEVVVTLDAPGSKVVEVLASEGDRVTSGQTLARLTRQTQEGPDAASAKSTTTTLKAPAAGVITRSTAVVGATPSPMAAEPLFRIAVDNEIELEAEVPSIHIPSLAVGQTARVEIGDNRELSGRVRLVPAVIDQTKQLGRARLSLERDTSLRLGMFAGATIDANRSCGISVPRSAVQHRTEGTSVQVVGGNAIERRLVQVGLHSDTHTEIRDGLREGEMVVANAGSSLRHGDKVRPIASDGTRIE
jgi:multidrug efflux pump subunit AcrA (membrane-fusion protein)